MYTHTQTHSKPAARATVLLLTQGAGKEATLHFFRVLALCHTVIPEWVEDSQTLVYRASSPGATYCTATACFCEGESERYILKKLL